MITFENYFINTKTTYKLCKTPKREPSFISLDRYGRVSSRYWYGEDSKGKFVIRESNHWMKIIPKNKERHHWKQCRTISTCHWNLYGDKIPYEIHPGIWDESIVIIRESVSGKAYLKNFIQI